MDFELPLLTPSILAADFRQLGVQIDACSAAESAVIHCDIMDGHFVPNISFGPMIVEAANSCTDAFLDVHMMIENPSPYIKPLVDAGANQLTVHQEACPHLHRIIQKIHGYDIAAGVAVNPGTSLQNIRPVMNDIETVLMMSVNPGFGGQSFIESTYKRLQKLCLMREEEQANFLIEVDGGVDESNIGDVVRSGAELLVAGSAVFKSEDITRQIQRLQTKARNATAKKV